MGQASDLLDLRVNGAKVTDANPAPTKDAATKTAVDAVATAVATQTGAAGTSPPTLASGASGLLGWLRKIVDVLSGSLTVSTGLSQPVTDAQLRASAVPVSLGSAPLPSGAATAANQTALAGLVGEVSTSPTSNTVLDRLKALLTGIILAGGENHVGEVGGNTKVVTANFTRPTGSATYAADKLIANNATAASVTPLDLTVARKNGGTGRILRARMSKTTTTLTNASFRLHLFRTAPSLSGGDTATFSSSVAGLGATYIGYIDFTMTQVFSDGAQGFGAVDLGPCISFEANGGVTTLKGLLEARAAYAAGSAETFNFALEVDRD